MEHRARTRSRARFLAMSLGVLVVGVAGYLGFVSFVESEPAVGAGVMALAAATGFAAFFSPCSFPLLLTFLTRRATESARVAVLSAIRVGAGAAALLALMAAVFAAGGSAFTNVVGFDTAAGRSFRVLVGAVLVLFGLRQATSLWLRMRWLDRVAGSAGRVLDPSRVSSDMRRDVLYGFGYLLAGFG